VLISPVKQESKQLEPHCHKNVHKSYTYPLPHYSNIEKQLIFVRLGHDSNRDQCNHDGFLGGDFGLKKKQNHGTAGNEQTKTREKSKNKMLCSEWCGQQIRIHTLHCWDKLFTYHKIVFLHI
jgi:hypothetical protein